MQRTVGVVQAGLAVPSTTAMLADQLSQAVRKHLTDQQVDVVLDVINLRDFAQDIANNLVTGYAGPELAKAIERIAEADAMIAVSPTFSASYSGLFKSFFDVLDPKFIDGMPVLFGATGGTSRHSLMLETAMRPLFSYLRANTMPTAIYAAPEDWGNGSDGSFESRINAGASELVSVIAPATGASQHGFVTDHKKRRADNENQKLTSLPFEELLAQTQRF